MRHVSVNRRLRHRDKDEIMRTTGTVTDRNLRLGVACGNREVGCRRNYFLRRFKWLRSQLTAAISASVATSAFRQRMGHLL